MLTPLLSVDGERVRILGESAAGTAGETLYLRRSGSYLARSLRRDLLLRLDVRDPAALVAGLVGAVHGALPETSRDELARTLGDRQMVLSSLLGGGIAVPHDYSSAIESHLCALALVPGGVDLGAPDGEPVRLVFLLLSPVGDPEGHLATLAEIARLVSNDAVRARLLSAATPQELLTRILETSPGTPAPTR